MKRKRRLKAGKKYYARVRTYTVDSMKNPIYGAYSTVEIVKVKGWDQSV